MMLKKLSPRELQLLLLGSCTAIIYLFILVMVPLYQMEGFAFQLFYLVSAVAFPFGLLWIFRRCFSMGEEKLNDWGVWLIFSNLLVIARLCFLTPPYSVEIATYTLVVWSVFQALFWIFHGWETKIFKTVIDNPWFSRLMCAMIALIPAVAFLNTHYALFLNSGYNLLHSFYLGNQKIVVWVFSVVSIFVVMLLVQVFVFEKRKPSSFSRYYSTLLCFSPILLFDVVNNFDVEHYNAYVAPAIAVLHGKIPLIEVFCHYGFSYLLFTAVFMLLPNNYGVLGAVVSAMNVWCLILFLFMLKRVVKNRTYFLILSITSVFGSHYLMAHTENIVPSALAMRYFPTFLIMYVLFKRFYDPSIINGGHFFRSPTILFLLALNALWSLESILFLIVIVSTYFWLSIDSWKSMMIAIFKLFSLIFFVYLAIAIFYMIFFHQLPSYKFYLKYIYYYFDPNTKIGARFLLVGNSFLSRFLIWIPMAIMHVVGLFYLIYHRFVKKIENPEVKSILFVNAAAVACIVYFVFQPSLFTYICTGYPSLFVLISSLIQLKEKTKSNCFKFGLNLSLIMMTYLFLVIMGLSVNSKPTTGEPSGNILTQFLYDGNFFHENFFYNLNHFCTKKKLEDREDILAITENTCSRNAYHDEMYGLINKWFKDEKEILLFHRDLTESLVEHNKIHRLMVSPLNDYLSYDIRNYVLEKVDSLVKLGDIVIVEKDLNLFPIENTILKKMDTLFNFFIIEKTPHFNVFRLTEKKESSQLTDIKFSINPKGAMSSLVYNEKYNIEEVKEGVSALFDHDKETSWFATKRNAFNKHVFWVKINLGGEFLIENIKIWRTIDFRVPGHSSRRRDIFPRKFNIKFSMDGKLWTIEKSEFNKKLEGEDYYSANFSNKSAKYIMVSVLLNEETSFSISEIEIFGKKVAE